MPSKNQPPKAHYHKCPTNNNKNHRQSQNIPWVNCSKNPQYHSWNKNNKNEHQITNHLQFQWQVDSVTTFSKSISKSLNQWVCLKTLSWKSICQTKLMLKITWFKSLKIIQITLCHVKDVVGWLSSKWPLTCMILARRWINAGLRQFRFDRMGQFCQLVTRKTPTLCAGCATLRVLKGKNPFLMLQFQSEPSLPWATDHQNSRKPLLRWTFWNQENQPEKTWEAHRRTSNTVWQVPKIHSASKKQNHPCYCLNIQ